MKLNKLMEIVHGAYPDELSRTCWDPEKQRPRANKGATLAEFVVEEIADTFDGMANTGEQLEDALDAMRGACVKLTAVIAALEKRKDSYAQTGR